jgi:hypothetical protein
MNTAEWLKFKHTFVREIENDTLDLINSNLMILEFA